MTPNVSHKVENETAPRLDSPYSPWSASSRAPIRSRWVAAARDRICIAARETTTCAGGRPPCYSERQRTQKSTKCLPCAHGKLTQTLYHKLRRRLPYRTVVANITQQWNQYARNARTGKSSGYSCHGHDLCRWLSSFCCRQIFADNKLNTDIGKDWVDDPKGRTCTVPSLWSNSRANILQ